MYTVRVVAYMNESTSQMRGFYHGGALQMFLYRCRPEKQLVLFELGVHFAYIYFKDSVFLLYFGANVSLTETLQPERGGY